MRKNVQSLSTKIVIFRPFNLHPEKWFEGYPVKSTQIIFRRAPWKKLDLILINQKKIRRAAWKNLSRFYRVDFTGYPSNHFSGCRLNGRLLLQAEQILKMTTVFTQIGPGWKKLSFCELVQLLTTVFFFLSIWDKSRGSTVNWSRLEKM